MSKWDVTRCVKHGHTAFRELDRKCPDCGDPFEIHRLQPVIDTDLMLTAIGLAIEYGSFTDLTGADIDQLTHYADLIAHEKLTDRLKKVTNLRIAATGPLE